MDNCRVSADELKHDQDSRTDSEMDALLIANNFEKLKSMFLSWDKFEVSDDFGTYDKTDFYEMLIEQDEFLELVCSQQSIDAYRNKMLECWLQGLAEQVYMSGNEI